ncbi:MAG: hypothetical protein E7328_06970 [Clostridiales bacterium]|nr:hypothetical protein [Clostridiales bacterium]
MKTYKKANTRSISLMVAVVLFVCGIVGGTLAWLTDKTESVDNTFTVSGIDITLVESAGGDEKEFQMIPGHTIEKDPKVTVVEGSEDCWLFVKVKESANLDDYISYEIAEGWEPVAGTTDVYARKVLKTDAVKAFSVLKDDKVTVNPGVTKQMMDALKDGNLPELSFTAYACQYMKDNNNAFTAAEAWEKLQ